MKNLIILILFSVLTVSASAQPAYFPSCNDLEITKMQFDKTTGNDTLYVTVYNDCDTCNQAVYTGIIVYRGKFISLSGVEDTLAIDINYGTEWTPENNSVRTYTAIVKKHFDLKKDFKVGLLGVCDSIPLSPDVILGLKEESTKDKKKVLLKSNGILISMPGLAIQDVSVYSLSGQLVHKKSGIFSTEFTLKPQKPGIYVVSVTLSDNEVVNLNYYETAELH
ncbi:hypothetical protein MASR2M47_06890 [Draconibacterium sp.]